jgi:peptidoglycan hydrolase-like protein with peptidoglycan-binding domain
VATNPSRRSLAAVLTALSLVLAAFVTGAVTAGAAGATSVEDTFSAKLNYARASRGIPRLVSRSALVTVARAQANRMANRNTLYHNPNLTTDVTNWRWVGENVGYGPDALTVHVAFMNSPGHRANILDRDYTEFGIGAVEVNGRVWVAEVFRRPMRITTSSVATFSHILRYGSTGSAVKRVQGRLHLRQTGFYGTYTRAAVSRFQKSLGWRGRGNVGPGTWHRLFGA